MYWRVIGDREISLEVIIILVILNENFNKVSDSRNEGKGKKENRNL